MPANVENSAVATGLERSFSLQSPKKVISKNVQLPHSCTHLTGYQSNFSKQVFSGTWTEKLHMFKLDLEKAEEPEIKLPTSLGSLKQQEFQKNIYFCLLTMPKVLTVWTTTNCGKFFKRWEYQTTWPASWETCMQVRKQQLELDMEQQTGSK